MAKFMCVCGETLRTSGEVPNPIEYRILADADFYPESDPPDAVDHLYRASTIAYRCPRSGHLWVFWDGFQEPPTLYSLEKVGYAQSEPASSD